jgi:hypothetical protein
MGALSDREKEEMLNAGWMKSEVRDFNNAKTPDGETQVVAFNSAPFQRMMMTRKSWVKECKKAGIDNKGIRETLDAYYSSKRSKRTPWDFLKIEYQPTQRGLSDTEFGDKLKIRARIRRILVSKTKVEYGIKLKKEYRPRDK